MALKFRKDEGLFVLALASHEDLEQLASVLTHDGSDGEKRRTQELLGDPVYQAAVANDDLRPAWKSIAAELQAYGGDSIANTWRSVTQDHTGVPYREIVTDICDHLKLKHQPATGIKELEDQLLIELITHRKDKVQVEGLVRIMEGVSHSVGMEGSVTKDLKLDDLARLIGTDASVSYLAALVAPVVVSAALPSLARLFVPTVLAPVAPRLGGALVPGMNAAALTSVVMLLTSPALRVTLPAVLEVIRIRRLLLLSPLSVENAA